MKFGSYEHKKLFCQSFIDSHASYSPERLSWPQLDDLSLGRLQSIPFWLDFLKEQQKTARIVHSYAQTVRDPLMKEAIALLAEEEEELVKTLSSMMSFYDLPNPNHLVAVVPSNAEMAFIDSGFEGCLDSFLGFGLFGVAQKANYLPDAFLQVLNSVLDAKARQIIFFINWWSYWNIKLKQRKGWSEIRGFRALWHRRSQLIMLLKALEQEEFEEVSSEINLNSGRLIGELTLAQFLKICQAEHSRRMQNFSSSLERPHLNSLLANFIQRVLKFWPQRVGT